MFSKYLIKLAQQLKISTLISGWLTPHGDFSLPGPFGHSILLEEHQQLLNLPQKELKPGEQFHIWYQTAFQQGWLRWFAEHDELGFEGTKETFEKFHQQIIAILDKYPFNEVRIEVIQPFKALSVHSFHFMSNSAAEKAFRQRGIQGLISFFSSGSELRRFL